MRATTQVHQHHLQAALSLTTDVQSYTQGLYVARDSSMAVRAQPWHRIGAGLYEHRVVISKWHDVPPAEWPNTGLMFWAYVTTVPLTLLTLLNAFAAWTAPMPMRTWYLASVIVIAVERAATLAYFMPAMLRLMRMNQGPEVSAGLTKWLGMNHVRHLLTLLGWLAALRAFSLLA